MEDEKGEYCVRKKTIQDAEIALPVRDFVRDVVLLCAVLWSPDEFRQRMISERSQYAMQQPNATTRTVRTMMTMNTAANGGVTIDRSIDRSSCDAILRLCCDAKNAFPDSRQRRRLRFNRVWRSCLVTRDSLPCLSLHRPSVVIGSRTKRKRTKEGPSHNGDTHELERERDLDAWGRVD
jgi:hypothetical protein